MEVVLRGGVRDNVATLYRASEDGFGSPLPAFVREELDGYLGCRVLGRGFAHLVCKDCGAPHLLALSCGGRGFCPSCTGRRMAQTAANLIIAARSDAFDLSTANTHGTCELATP